MNRSTLEQVVEQIDSIHRELGRMAVAQRLGRPSALKSSDVLESHPLPVADDTLGFLCGRLETAADPEEMERIERTLFGCMDLVVEKETCQLADMVNFYSEGGRMHVGQEKVPMLDAVSWLQNQSDFDKREKMKSECTIFFKAITNPILTGITELTTRTVTEKFGYDNYVDYCQAKKKVSFDEYVPVYEKYLEDTETSYRGRISPWVNEKIGRKFENLSRYHALYLVRIRRFDEFFRSQGPEDLVREAFRGLGFDLSARSDVVLDTSDYPAKNPDGICIGVEIPGEVHVLMKSQGGLIDVETLLHETGHAFFLSHFDPLLPMEYRRLYRSPALDETFAFLFTDLIGNRHWLTRVARMPEKEADSLADLYWTKQLCMIRRHIGKFLAEKEFFENGDIKDSSLYCKHLEQATGFIYEPEGYLVDLAPDFYALEYLRAWAAAHAMKKCLQDRFGQEWFITSEAGEFLKSIAACGRVDPPEKLLTSICEQPPRLPEIPDP